MTALAIPARLMPVASSAQPGIPKIAPGSIKDAAKGQEADVTENPEPFHSLMEELSFTEMEPATQPVKIPVTNIFMNAGPKEAPARALAFQSPRQVVPAADEKPKSKSAKRDANNELALSLPVATPVTESKPPTVWSLPQMQAAPETIQLQAATTDPEYAPRENEKTPLRMSTEDNRPQQKAIGGLTARTVQGESLALPGVFSQEPALGRETASSTVETASDDGAQAMAIKVEDSPSVDPTASSAPTAPTGGAAIAKVAFEARLRPIQTDPTAEQGIVPGLRSGQIAAVSPRPSADPDSQSQPVPVAPKAEQQIGLETHSSHADIVSPPSSAFSPRDPSTTTKSWFEARPFPFSTPVAAGQKIGPETRPIHTIEPPDSLSVHSLASANQATSLSDVTTAKAAFEARPWAALPVQAAAPERATQTRMVKPEPTPVQKPAQETSDAPRPAAAASEKHNDNQRDQQEREPKTAPPAAAASTPVAAQHVETEPSATTNLVDASMPVHAPAVSGASAPVSVPAPPASHAPAATADVKPTADAPPSPTAANDIKIALNDNGQRVELRVTERAGDIHVTVRTPDSQLATAMREDLPALSSRLEQSGLHSEMWRPTASAASENRGIETSAGNTPSDSREQPGGRQQQEDRQQDPRNPQQTLNRKSDRKEFSWLFESIR